jgi:cobalt-zinc-cadmium efflux system membrane fusion protein
MLAGCNTASDHAVAAATSTQPPPGSFRLTDEQISSMQVQAVRSLPFHSEVITDGKIAYDADRLTPVYSPFSGRVTQLVAPLGARVRRGAPLFRLQAAEYAQGASDLVTAQTQLRLNTLIEQRRHAQYLSHGASLQDWQQAQSDLEQSHSTLSAVRGRLRILGLSDAQIDALAAGGAAMGADAIAVAPIDGTVVDRQIGPGQYVQAGGAVPVYTVADLSKVWLLAQVPEADAGQIRAGEVVTADVFGVPGHTFQARLSYVAASLDPTTRRLTVHAELDNRGGMLRAEMFATLTIATSDDVMALAIPQQAVIYQGTETRVWVLQDSHDAALRVVKLGRSLNGNVEVLEGLRGGEQVVTRGALFIDRAASSD